MNSFVWGQRQDIGPQQRASLFVTMLLLLSTTLLISFFTSFVSAEVYATTPRKADATTALGARIRNNNIGSWEATFHLYIPEAGKGFFTTGSSQTFEPSSIICQVNSQLDAARVVSVTPTDFVYTTDMSIKTIQFKCAGSSLSQSDHNIVALIKIPYNFPYKVTVAQNIVNGVPSVVESAFGFAESGFEPSLVRSDGTNANSPTYTFYINNLFAFSHQPKLLKMLAFQIQYLSVGQGLVNVMPTSAQAATDETSALTTVTLQQLSADTFGIASLPAGTRAISFTFARSGNFPVDLQKVDFNWVLIDPTEASAPRLSPLMYNIPVSALPPAINNVHHIKLNNIIIPTTNEVFTGDLAELREIKYSFTIIPPAAGKTYAFSIRPNLAIRDGLFFAKCSFTPTADLSDEALFFSGNEANPRIEFVIGATIPTATLTCVAAPTNALLTKLKASSAVYKNILYNIEASLYELGAGAPVAFVPPFEFASRGTTTTRPTLPNPVDDSAAAPINVAVVPARYGFGMTEAAKNQLEWLVTVSQNGIVSPNLKNQKLESLTDVLTTIEWVSTTASVWGSDGSSLVQVGIVASTANSTDRSKTLTFTSSGIHVNPVTVYRVIKSVIAAPSQVGDEVRFALASKPESPVPPTVSKDQLINMDLTHYFATPTKIRAEFGTPLIPGMEVMTQYRDNYFIPKSDPVEVISNVTLVPTHHLSPDNSKSSNYASNSLWNLYTISTIWPKTQINFWCQGGGQIQTVSSNLNTVAFFTENPDWSLVGTQTGCNFIVQYNGIEPLVLTKSLAIPFVYTVRNLDQRTGWVNTKFSIKTPNQTQMRGLPEQRISFARGDPVKDSLITINFVVDRDTGKVVSIPRLVDGSSQPSEVASIPSSAELQITWDPRPGNPLDHVEFEIWHYPMKEDQSGYEITPVMLLDGFTPPSADGKIGSYNLVDLFGSKTPAASYDRAFFRIKYVYPESEGKPNQTLDTIYFNIFNNCVKAGCDAAQECRPHVGECFDMVGSCPSCSVEGTMGCGSTIAKPCICKKGYTGIACGTPTMCAANVKDKCDLGHGYLPFTDSNKCADKCTCINLWSGNHCDQCSITCQNSGAVYGNCLTCGCPAGFAGDQCECSSSLGSITLDASNTLLVETNGKFSFSSGDAFKIDQDIITGVPYSANATTKDVQLYEMMRDIYLGLRQPVTNTATTGKFTYSMTPVKNGKTVFEFIINFNCTKNNPHITTNEQLDDIFTRLATGFNDQLVIRKYFTTTQSQPPIITTPIQPHPSTLPKESNSTPSQMTSWIALVVTIFGLVVTLF